MTNLDTPADYPPDVPPGHRPSPTWPNGPSPERPPVRPVRLLVAWAVAAVAVFIAAAIVPGVSVDGLAGAFVAAALIAVLNALIPPVIAALRLPFTVALGFLLVLAADAVVLLVAADFREGGFSVSGFIPALVAALVIAAATIALDIVLGTNDDDTYTIRVIQRIARRSQRYTRTNVPGIVYLEVDGLAAPVLRRAMTDGSAPEMARWLAEGTHRLTEWEPDLSSQTGASQAGILLGSNDDIPAFRWVEKETGLLMSCSAPADCAEIERRHSTGKGLLRDGGASRGNLLSGEADEAILTISRFEAEKKANPGYRPFLANGFNVTRAFVLFIWEVVLETSAKVRAARRNVQPSGHRSFSYALMRGGVSVVVRDLVVYSVLSDMMTGRPAIYATFSGYDEVAHHSGLERADTLEVLRKIDQQFGRIVKARRYAPRPYEIVVLSDHGQTQGATFKQRNGYGLDELVKRSLGTKQVASQLGGDENDHVASYAFQEATGRKKDEKAKNDVSDQDVVVLGSGNLGLIYLMDERRRLTLEEIEERHPELLSALRGHPHVGWLLVRSDKHGAVVLGRDGAHRLCRRPGQRRRPARRLLAVRGTASGAYRRVLPRGRHHGEQFLRPPARGGLRLRGADLVPRRHGRPADARHVVAPGGAPRPRRAHRRGRAAAPGALGLARVPAGPAAVPTSPGSRGANVLRRLSRIGRATRRSSSVPVDPGSTERVLTRSKPASRLPTHLTDVSPAREASVFVYGSQGDAQ